MKKMTVILILLSALGSLSSKQLKPDAARQFLASLDEAQRERAQLPFEDSSRSHWHYLPATSYTRAGISLGELDNTQRQLFFSLLKTHLSETGYNKTQKILELEEILGELENNPTYRNPDNYFVAFYGEPDKNSLWGWSFEGHHLSLNFTMADGEISMAPRFMGANPAIIPEGKRKGEKTLAREEDLAFQLLHALPASQRQQAIFRKQAFWDITTSNDSQVEPMEPLGIRLKDLTPDHQAILLELIDEYLASMPAELATLRMNLLKTEEFDQIRFGWAGGTQPGEPHYYRVQGKTFLIELDNTQNGANHIHSVWRDFDGDFGHDLIREHYEHSNHHDQ